MIIKLSQKTNANGWRRQAIIDTDAQTIIKGSFLFHYGDIEKLTATQYKQFINYFKSQGFKEV